MKRINKLLAVFVLSLTLGGLVYAASESISGLSQTVDLDDVITSAWYNTVNKMLNGPHTDGGFCTYSGGKILCNSTIAGGPTGSITSVNLADAICPTGQVLRGFNPDGSKNCSALNISVLAQDSAFASIGTARITATCPTGRTAVSGGFNRQGGSPNDTYKHTYQSTLDGNGWTVGMASADYIGYAICIKIE